MQLQAHSHHANFYTPTMAYESPYHCKKNTHIHWYFLTSTNLWWFLSLMMPILILRMIRSLILVSLVTWHWFSTLFEDYYFFRHSIIIVVDVSHTRVDGYWDISLQYFKLKDVSHVSGHLNNHISICTIIKDNNCAVIYFYSYCTF